MSRPRKQYHRDQRRDGISVSPTPAGSWRLRVWDSTHRRYRSTNYATEADAKATGEQVRAGFVQGLDNAAECTLDGVWNAFASEHYGLTAQQVVQLEASTRAGDDRTAGGERVADLRLKLKAKWPTVWGMHRLVSGLRSAGATNLKRAKPFRSSVARMFNGLKLSRSKSQDGRVAVSTRRRMLGQIRALVNFARTAGWVVSDPLAGYSPIGAREQDDTNRETFTVAEVRKFVGLNRPADPPWVHAMLMLYGGLRESEARALTWQDYDREARLLWVRHGKGNKVRNVPVQTELVAILDAVARESGPAAKVAAMPTARIVAAKRGRAVTFQHFRALLRDAGVVFDRGVDSITKMPRTLSRHSCRHTCCAILLATGEPGDALRIIFGHGSEDLTTHYASQVALYKRLVDDEGWPRGRLCFSRRPTSGEPSLSMSKKAR
jgi:integrase